MSLNGGITETFTAVGITGRSHLTNSSIKRLAVWRDFNLHA